MLIERRPRVPTTLLTEYLYQQIGRAVHDLGSILEAGRRIDEA
jgi:hypothetical protein